MPFCPQGPLLPQRRVVTNKGQEEYHDINTSPSGHPSCKPSSCSNSNSHSNRAMPSLPQVISCFSMKLPCTGDYISVPHISQRDSSQDRICGREGSQVAQIPQKQQVQISGDLFDYVCNIHIEIYSELVVASTKNMVKLRKIS